MNQGFPNMILVVDQLVHISFMFSLSVYELHCPSLFHTFAVMIFWVVYSFACKLIDCILASLCRIIFSAHTHEFSSYFHPDGTREVTVPALTWNARDDPGFIVANFRRNNIAVSISYCSLVRESRLIMGYVYVMVLFVVMMVFSRILFICSRQW